MMQRNITLLKKAWTGIQSITAKITGTNTDAVYVETSDADATAADMLNGKTAYVNASKVTGSIATKSSSDLAALYDTVTVPAGYYASNASKAISPVTIDELDTVITKNTSTHVATITPYFVTEEGGYLEPDEYTGTASTVSASELVSGSETKTANGTYDVTNLAELVVNVSGGGSGLTLLATKSLGTISTSSTTAADTGQTVSVPDAGDYDFLIVQTYCQKTNSRHLCTIAVIELYSTADAAAGRSSATIATAKMNMKADTTGHVGSRVGTTAYGIYPNSCTISGGDGTIPMYQRYNSTSTGTINGSYTTDVYGVKMLDLII